MIKQHESIHRHLIDELKDGTDFPSLLAHYFLAREVPPAILGAVSDIAARWQTEKAAGHREHPAEIDSTRRKFALMA